MQVKHSKIFKCLGLSAVLFTFTTAILIGMTLKTNAIVGTKSRGGTILITIPCLVPPGLIYTRELNKTTKGVEIIEVMYLATQGIPIIGNKVIGSALTGKSQLQAQCIVPKVKGMLSTKHAFGR